MEITNNFTKGHTSDDFIIGNYYFITDDLHPEAYIIFLCTDYPIPKDKDRGKGHFVANFNSNKKLYISNTPWIRDRNIRIATNEEIKHLNKCIQENKFIPFKNNIIPEKWCIKITNDNAKELSQFLKEKCHEYIGYVESWDPQSAINYYMVYPQIEKHSYSYREILPRYNCIEITTEFFKKHILKKNNINKLKEFPNEGCCETLRDDIIEFLNKRQSQDKTMIGTVMSSSTGISWSKIGWYFVRNVKSCIRKEYKIEELEHFFKKENKEELINKLTTTKKEENYECTSKNKSIKICRPDFKVSKGLRKRGIGIKSAGVKILIGNRHCNN